jgi:2-dehydropantoate 2-reductase
MRFLCFGTGAIGTYIGGSLALSGNEVVFLDRPEVAEALRQSGLRLGLPEGERGLTNPTITADLNMALALGPFDAALLAVKAFDTPALLETLAPAAQQIPPVVSFQNGVENEPAIAAALGKDWVIPATVTTAVGRRGAGSIVVERLRGIGITTVHPLSAALLDAANQAGLRAKGYSNPAAMKWSKMITNLITNATSAILDMTPGEIFARSDLYCIENRQLREALRVMRAQNIPVVDLPSTPVRLLALVIERLPRSISRPLLARAVGAGRGAKMPSFHIDLVAGRRKSEVDYLNGAVVRYGRKFHVSTPVNQVLNETLLAMVRGDVSRERYARSPEKLLAQIPEE